MAHITNIGDIAWPLTIPLMVATDANGNTILVSITVSKAGGVSVTPLPAGTIP